MVESSATIRGFNARPNNVEEIIDIILNEVEKLQREQSRHFNAHFLSNPFTEAIMQVDY